MKGISFAITYWPSVPA